MGYTFTGSYGHVLAAKLKALKQDIKKWNKEVFGNVITRENEALKKISFWDSKERETTLIVDELEARRAMLNESCRSEETT